MKKYNSLDQAKSCMRTGIVSKALSRMVSGMALALTTSILFFLTTIVTTVTAMMASGRLVKSMASGIHSSPMAVSMRASTMMGSIMVQALSNTLMAGSTRGHGSKGSLMEKVP